MLRGGRFLTDLTDFADFLAVGGAVVFGTRIFTNGFFVTQIYTICCGEEFLADFTDFMVGLIAQC